MLASKTKMFRKVVNKKVYENVIKVKCNSCIFKLFHLQSGSQGCSFSKQSIWSGVQSRPYKLRSTGDVYFTLFALRSL